jgi:hypothetical protein
MHKDDLDLVEKCAATSLTTALTLLLTLILCGPAAVAQSTAFHSNGAFANAFGCSVSQTSIDCIEVSVFASSANGTFLFYDHSISDLNTGFLLQDTSGFGTIPNSTFQVHGQTDSLNVDTSKVAGFVNQFCTFDPNTGIPTCNSIPGGVVTGTWTVITNLDTTHSSGASSQILPNAIFITNGTFDSQAALASANVLGAALANVTGQVGKQISTFISVQVRH